VTQSFLQSIATETLMVTLKVALPTLLVSLGVGLVVSVVQAVTQLQEQTLTFIPKAFAVGMVLVLLGPWMMNTLISFTIDLYAKIPTLTGGG
jgi:flagellar biosynthetic protein FliQ